MSSIFLTGFPSIARIMSPPSSTSLPSIVSILSPPRIPALSAGPLEFTSIIRNPRASVRFIFFAISGVTSTPVIPSQG